MASEGSVRAREATKGERRATFGERRGAWRAVRAAPRPSNPLEIVEIIPISAAFMRSVV